jgi:hypothetical protein
MRGGGRRVLDLSLVGVLAVAFAACTSDPYPMPMPPPHTFESHPAAVGQAIPSVVLFIQVRPGDRIELSGAEPIGTADGATVAAFSDAMALMLRQRESVIGTNTILTLPLTFLSAAFMPLALVPDWIATIARFNPVNWAVEAGREALTASPDWTMILPRIGGLLVLAVLATAWATRTFRAYQKSI